MPSTVPPAPEESARTAESRESNTITVTVEKPAHGGTFVGRHGGRVVFVRGAAPGETVVARLLPGSHETARFWRAEAVEVIEDSPDRVPSAWPESGSEGIGGADFAHIRIEAQRRIKTEVLQELLTRGKIESFPIDEVQVEPAPQDYTGLGWRTRVRFAADGGKVGMRGWRSHEVHPVGSNPLAVPAIHELGIGAWKAPVDVEYIDAVAPSAGPAALVIRAKRDLSLEELALPKGCDKASVIVVTEDGHSVLRGDDFVKESVGPHTFTVSAGGFWQVHASAPAHLTELVVNAVDAQPGETVWDLYGGAGLFSVPLAEAVGSNGTLVSVEGSPRASSDAAANLGDMPQASAVEADVAEFVASAKSAPDRIVLDPPRSGVGEALMAQLCRAVRQSIVYVSCEPSTLVRDLRVAEAEGWSISDLRACDLFPHTHHMECVVTLERSA